MWEPNTLHLWYSKYSTWQIYLSQFSCNVHKHLSNSFHTLIYHCTWSPYKHQHQIPWQCFYAIIISTFSPLSHNNLYNVHVWFHASYSHDGTLASPLSTTVSTTILPGTPCSSLRLQKCAIPLHHKKVWLQCGASNPVNPLLRPAAITL